MRRSFAVPLYVALVFLSGALVGGVGYRLYNVKTVDGGNASAASKPRLSPEEWRRHMVEMMRTRLSLSDEQVAKLQAAYDETRQRFDAYDQRSKAERRAIIEAQHEKVRAFLNDQQRAEYEKFLQERQKQHQEEKKKHPGS
jgi:uncharacterized membrane protein